MKNIIIYGNTSFSCMIAEYIKKCTDWNISCFCVDKQFIDCDTLMDIPVIPFEEIENKYSCDNHSFIITIGYSKMNTIRESAYIKVSNKGYKLENFIHPTATINADEIGDGNIILENVFLGPHTKVGNANIFWNGANICHDCEIGNFNQISASAVMSGCAKVKDNCFIGMNASIRDHVTVKNKTLVGAGTFINEDTEENGVYVPARAVKLDKDSLEINI